MTTYATNNPVGSSDPRDLYDNSQNFDHLSVDRTVESYPDRFGNMRMTWHGIEEMSKNAISEFGWIPVGTFQAGATLSLPNHILKDTADNEYYRWDGALPKVVPAGSTPTTSGGVGIGAWVSVGDASLRSDLSSTRGWSYIGEFESVADLAGVTGFVDQALVSVKSFLTGRSVGGGQFRWMASSSLADDGFSVIKPTSVTGNGRWVNVRRGYLTPPECGAVPDDSTFDSAVALNRWVSQNYCEGTNNTYYSSRTIEITSPGNEVHINAKKMKIVITSPDFNGVTVTYRYDMVLVIEKLKVHAADGINGTIQMQSCGFLLNGLQRLEMRGCEAENWRNAGCLWLNVRHYVIEGFFGWRNDWDGSTTFSSGGDLVEWTGIPGNSKSGRIINNTCYSDASQSISVNSLSAARNVIISDNQCLTYSKNEFTSKPQADIKKRHGITIGYVSHQDYGGAIKVNNNLIRDAGWTGIY